MFFKQIFTDTQKGILRQKQKRDFIRHIKENGPISFRDFFAWSIQTYYRDWTAIGPEGPQFDFKTNAERTPEFGYALARQIIEMWEKLDCPSVFTVLELGAGNGTLAKAILDYISRSNDACASCTKYIIVEQSPSLSTKQKELLVDYPVAWVETSAASFSMPIHDGVFISNELLDTFPARRVRTEQGGTGLEEAYVGVKGDVFFETWIPLEKSPHEAGINAYIERLKRLRGDTCIERVLTQSDLNVNEEILKFQQMLARQLKRGYVITIDYGYGHDMQHIPKQSVRTYSRNDFSDNSITQAYQRIGQVDITQNVDFVLMVDEGEQHGLTSLGILAQDRFLKNLEVPSEAMQLILNKGEHSDGFFVAVQCRGVDTDDASLLRGLTNA